jgi:hypothetical protein
LLSAITIIPTSTENPHQLFSSLQPCDYIQCQPHKQPDHTKDHKNRHQHRIRKREIPGLIILLQQQYPKEHTNKKCDEPRQSDIPQWLLLRNEPNHRIEHTIKPLKNGLIQNNQKRFLVKVFTKGKKVVGKVFKTF